MRTRFLLALSLLVSSACGQTARPTERSQTERLQTEPPGDTTITIEQNGTTRRYRVVADEPPPTTGPTTPTTEPRDGANFAILNTIGMAPALVNVHAFSLPAGDYDPMTSRCTWTFGDPTGTYDTLTGFNAAHVYDRPGNYTISLLLEKADGTTKTYTRAVRVAPDNRAALHVSSDGDDNNPGSIDQPIKTFAAATRRATENVAVLLRRGDSFVTSDSFTVKGNNVLIGSYGDANLPKPVIVYAGALGSTPIIRCTGQTFGLTVRDVTFDSVFNKDTEKRGMPDCVLGAGQNIALVNVTFLNVGYGLNGNGFPLGLMMVNCDAPLETGIRSYLAWVQGRDQVIVGNRVSNSTREHAIRCNGFERLLIAHNDFTNLDRKSVDKYDAAKGALVIQSGKYVWATGNRVNGASGVGPLGDKDGLTHPEARTQFAVIERNHFERHSFTVGHGAEHVMVRDNRFEIDNDRSIEIDGYMQSYRRGTKDVTLLRNVAINRGTSGGFLYVGGPVDGVTVEENQYVAPLLAPGSHATAIVYVAGSDLTGFRSFARNVWPEVKPQKYAQGGVMYVWPKWSDSKGYLTPAVWATMPCVKDDAFRRTPLPPVVIEPTTRPAE